MGYQRGDNRYGGGNDRFGGGDDRGRGREQGSRYGGERGRGDWGGGRPRGDDDRGFFERAGEQVRSWFSDDDDDRSRGGYGGGDRFEQERGYRGGRETGGGGRDRDYGNDWGTAGRDRSSEGRNYGSFSSAGGGGGGGEEFFEGSGFGGGDGNRGRRFDRVDAGSTGTHGAHPMSSPVGGAYGGDYGTSAGGYGSSARSAAIMASQRGATNQGRQQGGGYQSGGIHDDHYSQWRNRQIESLDRDYDEYRREHQSKFEQEFHGWREKRQGQRSAMGKVTPHMEVLGADGQHIGVVDAVKGDRIILTKNDENAGGVHHSIPCSWIERVEDKVYVNKTGQEAMHAWKEEENNRALFERADQGSEGPHVLDRSFSGTYDRKD